METKNFLAVGAAIGALLLGLLVANFMLAPKTVALTTGTQLSEPRELPDFQLQDQDDRRISKADWLGHWTLIFPGFTYCPDVCPSTLGLLKQVQAALGSDSAKLKIVFLSVDPERDTPKRLAGYIHFFSPAFSAVTAQEPQLATFTKSLAVAYTKVAGSRPDNYSMDHTAALILLDPQARVTAFFTPPLKLEGLTADLQALLKTTP